MRARSASIPGDAAEATPRTGCGRRRVARPVTGSKRWQTIQPRRRPQSDATRAERQAPGCASGGRRGGIKEEIRPLMRMKAPSVPIKLGNGTKYGNVAYTR